MKSLLPISIIIAAIALFFLLTNPLYKDTQLLKTDVATYNKALDNSTQLQKEKDSLLEKYRNISETDRKRLDTFLPDNVNNIKFVLEIEQIANLHGMPLKDIKFVENKNTTDTNKNIVGNMVVQKNGLNNKAYGIFTVEFTTEGKYSSFLIFLKDLERNLRLMDIKSLSFEVPSTPKGGAKVASGINPDIYSYKLDVDTYWLK